MVDGYWECMFCGKYIGMEKNPHADVEVQRMDGGSFTGFVCEECFTDKERKANYAMSEVRNCVFCEKSINLTNVKVEVRRKDGSGFTGFVCEECFNKKMGYGEDLPVVVAPRSTSPQ